MSLGLALNIANTGMKAVEDAMAVASQNITNSQTPGYISENSNTNSATAGNIAAGVTTGPTRLNISQALQKSLYQQNADVASLTAQNNSLSALSSVEGTTTNSDGSNTIGTLTNNLQSVNTALISLTSTPNNSAAQASVVSAAQTLTNNINTLSSVYQTQRQTAQDNIANTVKSINSDLTTIGKLSQQIITAKGSHIETADLENQRYEAMNSLSSKLGVSFTEKVNGDMIVSTQDGTKLPTRPDQINQSDDGFKAPTQDWPLSTKDVNVSSSMYHATDGTNKGIPDITLAGEDITSHLTGGTLGANISLRDQTYPQMQAQLDSFSYSLINRFSQAGASLFTTGVSDGKGGTAALNPSPTQTNPNGIVNLSSQITVSQAYIDQPSKLVTDSDGTPSSSLAQSLITQAFGSTDSAVSGSLAAPTSGLGPDGQQATGYQGTLSLSQLATSLTTSQAGVISTVSSNLTTAKNIQTSLTTKISNVSGVDVNNQLAIVTTLKSAYQANAKVFSVAQSMFSSLLDAIN